MAILYKNARYSQNRFPVTSIICITISTIKSQTLIAFVSFYFLAQGREKTGPRLFHIPVLMCVQCIS